MLFSEDSIWTMVHGIALGGAALLALAALLFALYLMQRATRAAVASEDAWRPMAALTTFGAAAIWLTTLVGIYIIFPPYRATPPEGTVDLSEYPRALALSSPSTRWLHAFAMETKEHLPLIAAMLATAVAFVAWRYGRRLLDEPSLRRAGETFLAICFVLVAYLALLGVFVNKAVPLD